MKKIIFVLFIFCLLALSYLFINKSNIIIPDSYLRAYDTSDFIDGYKLQEMIYNAKKQNKNKILIKNNYLITEPLHVVSNLIIESESKENPFVLFFNNSGLLFNVKNQITLKNIKIF